jgi:hypothetical protein
VNAERSAAAIQRFQRAHRHAGTPPVDFCSRVLQPLEVAQMHDAAEALLEPGPLVQGAGEAFPALSEGDTDGRRDTMVDTLERPTTISVRASQQRLELAERLGVLQAAIDTAHTARASNAVEKMLCHQLAAVHNAAMNRLAYLPGAQTHTAATLPAGEMAKLGNTAARLMAVFVAGAQVLQKLKGGGTQRVIVQHQQVVVAQDGQTLIVNNPPRPRRAGGVRRNRGGARNGE